MTTHGETGHDAASSEGTVTVEETSAGGYTQQIAAGHHRLVPTPYDLLLAGKFSSDRAIAEYCNEIWNVLPVTVKV